MSEAKFPTIGEEFVGRYRIETVIGSGGFSQVYRARQTDLGRDVAIKVLKPVLDANKTKEEQLAKFEQVAKRFEREAKLISRLKDRNTVMMYDYGRTESGLLYMVLEFVDGMTISELLIKDGALESSRVVKILRQALQSLHEAHSMDVLHRDIKPGNIMVYDHVGREDLVKVLDFGIAKTVDSGTGRDESTSSSDVTADGVLVGTPRYMSPEQIRGNRRLGPGSDIYSLGLVAYEMLMGTKAVDADSSLRIIARHLDTEPIRVPLAPPVPSRLREIVNKMLLKDPTVRYGNCQQVIEDLHDWDTDVALAGGSDPTMTVDASDLSIEIARAQSQSTRWLVGGSVVLVLAIVAMLAMQRDPPLSEAASQPEPPAVVEAPVVDEEPPVDEPLPSPPGILAAAAASTSVSSAASRAEDIATATAELEARRPKKVKTWRKKTKRTDSATVKPSPKKKPTPFSLDQ